MIIIAGLRPIGSTPDTANYELLFQSYDDSSVMFLLEPTFQGLSYMINLYSDNVHWLFLVYAIIGISLKLAAIKSICSNIYMPLLVYLSNYYILHDLVQIRAGIASGILLLSIKPLYDGRRAMVARLYLLALLFHYSALIMFSLLVLGKKLSTWNRCLWGGLVIIGYLIYFVHIDIFSLLPIPFFQAKMETKELARDMGIESDINVFNLVFLVRVLVFFYCLIFYETIKHYNKYVSIGLKIMALSIFCFPAFSSMPVFGFRLSELFGIIDVIIYPSIFYTIRPRVLAGSVVILMAMILLGINIYYNQLVLEV